MYQFTVIGQTLGMSKADEVIKEEIIQSPSIRYQLIETRSLNGNCDQLQLDVAITITVSSTPS